MNFPALENKIYFDTARSGLMSDELLKWRKDHEYQFFLEGSQFRINHDECFDKTRFEINSFFNSPDSKTYLSQNFSIGFNSLIKIIKKDSKVMMIKGDYPSIIKQIMCSNLEYFFIDNSWDLENQIINGIKENNPSVFVFSIVQYIDGLLIDLDFIKKIKEQFPSILFIADGTQFFGTKFFEFNSSKIDVIISSGYKWMLGGYGNGFVSFNKSISLDHFIDNLKFQDLFDLFEPGHLDTLNFGSLCFSLNKLSKYGIKKIENKINVLSTYAKKKFQEKNLLDDKIIKRKIHSNIFNIKGCNLIYTELLKHKIICSKRGEGLRLSFNFYNTIDEIDFLMSKI